MPTIHCKKCELNQPCGNLHLYVVEFKSLKLRKNSKENPIKGIYTLDQQVKAWMKDLMIILLRKMESGSTIVKMLKEFEKYFKQFRPDLFYYDINPLKHKKNDKGQLERREGSL